MVKHIVLFKLKDDVPAEEKLAVMTKFKEAIEALPAKISVIRKVEVGLNINPGETMQRIRNMLRPVRFWLKQRKAVHAWIMSYNPQ